MSEPKKAIVLLSGGLDSVTCLALAMAEGYEVYALSLTYGQRHVAELEAAQFQAQQFGAKAHRIVSIPIGDWGGSALTDPEMTVPDYQGKAEIASTYVPARNTVFLSVALSWAEVIGAHDVFVGASQIDYGRYPDCRPEFFQAFQQLANCATKMGVEGQTLTVHTPLVELTKAETIALGLKLGVDYSRTISCYQADDEGRACGRCDSCTLRAMGFNQAAIPDPTRYQAGVVLG